MFSTLPVLTQAIPIEVSVIFITYSNFLCLITSSQLLKLRHSCVIYWDCHIKLILSLTSNVLHRDVGRCCKDPELSWDLWISCFYPKWHRQKYYKVTAMHCSTVKLSQNNQSIADDKQCSGWRALRLSYCWEKELAMSSRASKSSFQREKWMFLY